jgi:hypothetical protein
MTLRKKPLTKTERKILIFNKVKKGMTYDEAKQELNGELIYLKIQANKKVGRKKGMTKKVLNRKFKKDFDKLRKSK